MNKRDRGSRLGSELQGEEVWIAVSDNNMKVFDVGTSPENLAAIFEARTGVTWKEALVLGWRMERARVSYKITAELIER